MIYHEVERVKKVMKEKWLGDILEIYKVCVKKRQIPAQESRTYASFFKCLAVQMTLQIQQMTLCSMKDFDKFVLSLNSKDVDSQRSGFAMTLKLINNKIVFTPHFNDVEVIGFVF